MPDLPLATLQRLVLALDHIAVPYAIIGGVAVSIRSVPRYTQDVDAVMWFGETGWQELLDKLISHGFIARSSRPIEFARLNRLLLLVDKDGIQVDLSFGALPFEEHTVRNAERIEVADRLTAPIASAEALLIMKAIAWRPKDHVDIREIVAVNPGVDKSYVLTQFAEFAELLEVPERVSELRSMMKDATE